jgi:hypothetical protein
MWKGVTRARPPTRHNVAKALKAAGPSHRHHYALALNRNHQRRLRQARSTVLLLLKIGMRMYLPSWCKKRDVVSNSSSEYATTDAEEEDDDDSWALDEVSKGSMDTPCTGTGKHPLAVRLPSKLSANKQPKRLHSNLGLIQSGLLSQLLNQS